MNPRFRSIGNLTPRLSFSPASLCHYERKPGNEVVYRAEKHAGPDSRLQLSAILDKCWELVCGDFARELPAVTRGKKGEDAC